MTWLPGAVDTNPADAPTVVASGDFSKDARVAPPSEPLPTGWNTASWISAVKVLAGGSAHEISQPSVAGSQATVAWDWSTSAVHELTVGLTLDAQGKPTWIDCSVLGFDPGDSRAVSQISAMATVCASANFPGSRPATAQTWVKGQLVPEFAALNSMPHGARDQSATPAIGTGLFSMSAFYDTAYGNHLALTVWGVSAHG